MSEVINFIQNFKYYMDLVYKYSEEGRIIPSISMLRYAKSVAITQEDLDELELTTAQIYAEIGRFDQSNDMYYQMLERKSNSGDVYFGLAQNFFCLDKTDIANKYFEKLSEVEPELETEALNDYFDISEQTYDEEKYKVVYPVNNVDGERAKNLIIHGQIDEAIEVLKGIDSGCKNYAEAMNDLGMCYILKNKMEKARETIESVMAITDNDAMTFCNAIIIYRIFGKKNKEENTIKKLLKIESFNIYELTKVATVMCECGKHQEAVKYLKELLEQRPYVRSYMALLGIAHYNMGEYEAALDVFVDMYKLDNNCANSRYFIGVTKNAIEKFKANQDFQKILEYTGDLPNVEYARIHSLWSEIVANGNLNDLDDVNSKMWREFMWIMESGDKMLQGKIVTKLISSKINRTVEIIQWILVREYITLYVKGIAIQGLISKNQKEFDYVNYGLFTTHKIAYPNGFRKCGKGLKAAYGKAYALTLILDNNRLKTLPETFLKFKNSMEEKGLIFKISGGMAVLLLLQNGSGHIMPEDILCDMLDVKIEVLKKYQKQLKI